MTHPTVAPPKTLGRYEVGAKIGGGGMATVYVGRRAREDGDEELVALKVIRDELAHDEQFTAMFVDEAKILARLAHPNVIHTLEYGVNGVHRFIAMELLSGRTLADAWDVLAGRGERISLRLAAWICAQVAAGLHSAHELVDDAGAPLSVIHRDVNPTNIFLTHAGDVKLIDFGLAKARVRASRSADGIVKGKIPYLAPEQAQGRPIDRRIDVYALGATLWEAAAMARLFKRETDVETLKAIRDAHVPDLREQIEGFPEPLWEIIDRALRQERDERFATAAELGAALEGFVGDASDMRPALTELLGRLFPGDEAEHAQWLRNATSVRLPMATLPPPAPLPTASSTLLEDEEDAPPRSQPLAEGGEQRLEERSQDAGGEEPTSEPPASARPRLQASGGEGTERHRPAPVADARAPQQLWVSIAVVVAVLVLLALLLGAR